jgi:hypothetical protein
MSIESYYHRPPMLSRLREGTLGCYIDIDLFAEQLQREGHCQQGHGAICASSATAVIGLLADILMSAISPDYAECGSCDVTQNDTLSPISHGGDTQFGIVRDSA